MQNRHLIRYGYFVVMMALGCAQPSRAQPADTSDDMWKDYGLTCLEATSRVEPARPPIATLRHEFAYKAGPTHFAKDKDYAYILWGSIDYLTLALYRWPLASIGKKDQTVRDKLERFELTKASATCNKVDLIFFKIPQDGWSRGYAERKVLRIQGLLELGKENEDGKGEFGDFDLSPYQHQLRANIVEMTKDGNKELGSVLFERVAKIKKRFALKLRGASAVDVEVIDLLALDLCEFHRQQGIRFGFRPETDFECTQMYKSFVLDRPSIIVPPPASNTSP